ncbi:MAG: VWA domain-containing protein [Spirochaetales bacterium]|nr:VWA domain-containing protein [Spirochaetales bacterium]
MKNKILIYTVILLCLSAVLSSAQTVIVSQVDNSTLIMDQKIKVYVSVTDLYGNPITDLTQEQFELYEAVPDKKAEKREIIFFKHGANVNEGINLMFLMDNSGSMYTNMYGQETANESAWRITYAKEAIKELLRNVNNPEDRISLISFNIRLDSEVAPTGDKASIAKALTEIERPEKEESYTELYEALYHSVDKMSNSRGRKVIVLLSDGENFPTKDENPHFPERKGLEKAIELAQREGITVFTIGLIEGARDPDLRKIADDTGGVNYKVKDISRLKEFYNHIRDRVLHEYLIMYYAGMEPSEKKYVNVKLKQGATVIQAEKERAYYSDTLFGMPQPEFIFWIFFMIPFALLLLWLLSKVRFESKQKDPCLEVLTVDGKKKKMAPLTIMENQSAVTIGATESADLTIMGEPRLKSDEVIVQKKKGTYTVVSRNTPIKVNNQLVKSKELRSGDLIKVGNTTIVFNEGIEKKLYTDPRARKSKTVVKAGKPKPPSKDKTGIIQPKTGKRK